MLSHGKRPVYLRLMLLYVISLFTPTSSLRATSTYEGPGSLGAFTAFAVHPMDLNFMIAGANVGGVYLSDDDGASWNNITYNLPTLAIFSVAFSVKNQQSQDGTTVIILGTDSGVFYSDSFCRDAMRCGTVTSPSVWYESSGLERPDLDYNKHVLKNLHGGDLFGVPIGVVVVDRNNPDIVWAGVAPDGVYDMAGNKELGYQLQHFAEWQVYRSLDRGVSWEGELRLDPMVTPTSGDAFYYTGFDGENSEGIVFDIEVMPFQSRIVWVSTDRGLYRSMPAYEQEDANDLDWVEIGTLDRRQTWDKGINWTSMSAQCAAYSSGDPHYSWCLPIVTTAQRRFESDGAGDLSDMLEEATQDPADYDTDCETDPATCHPEDHPNLRSLASTTLLTHVGESVVATLRLYTTVWDVGAVPEDTTPDPCGSTDVVTEDAALDYFRGGVWYSDDLGETWAWTLTDTGAPPPEGTSIFTDDEITSSLVYYRCDYSQTVRASDDQFTACGGLTASQSYWTDSPPEHGAVLAAACYGKVRGLFTYNPYRTHPWDFHSNSWSSPGTTAIFEGALVENISTDPGDQKANGPIDIFSTWQGLDRGYPRVFLSTTRGVLEGIPESYPAPEGDYFFEHMGNDEGTGTPVSGGSGVLWTSTGLDDACVHTMAEVEGSFFLGVSDGGVIRRQAASGEFEDLSGWLWEPATPSSADKIYEDETRSIVVYSDDTTHEIYATNDKEKKQSSVLVTLDLGDSWEVIGGYGAVSPSPTFAEYNGLSVGSDVPLVRVLATVVTTMETSYRLLAGSDNGLWAYNPDESDEQWSRLCSSWTEDTTTYSLDGELVTSIAVNEDLADGYAFVGIDGSTTIGAVMVDLTSGDCQLLHASGAVLDVHSIAITSDGTDTYLLVGQDYSDGTSATAYSTIKYAELDTGAPSSMSWSNASGATALSVSGGADTTYSTHADKQWAFSSIVVDPEHPDIVWAGLTAGVDFDYGNPESLFYSDDAGLTFTAYGLTTLNIPSRNVKGLYMDSASALYVGTCASVYKLTSVP